MNANAVIVNYPYQRNDKGISSPDERRSGRERSLWNLAGIGEWRSVGVLLNAIAMPKRIDT